MTQNNAEVPQEKDKKQKRQHARATYEGSSVVPQFLFLVFFLFFPDPLYVAPIVALRCLEVQFPTTLSTRTNIKTNVVLQALSWKGQRVLFKGSHPKVRTQRFL